MQNLFRSIYNIFNRHQVVATNHLLTGIVCVHTLDAWRGVITINTKKIRQ